MGRFFREPMNGLTHCIGSLLALLATVLLLVRVANPPLPLHLVCFAVFGGAMILLYGASTLYHWLPLSDAGIKHWRRIDHCMIFIYIAATYTPICLIALRGAWGWSLFGVVWGIALAGLGIKLYWLDAPRWLSTGLYLGMGWMVVVGVYPLVVHLPTGALLWLLAGGLFYSVGAVIYARRRPNLAACLGFHELFHLFVMAGSLCHFVVMYNYISMI
ncbi:MAG: hemolysin III family protein [Bilophila sp.]